MADTTLGGGGARGWYQRTPTSGFEDIATAATAQRRSRLRAFPSRLNVLQLPTGPRLEERHC